MTDSNFVKYVDNGSDNCVIVFSSVNVPLGKFSMSRALDRPGSSSFDLLFVNCQNNSWYLNSFYEGNDWKNNLQVLDSYLIKKNYKKKLAIGGSMGGYGAILYGCYLGVDKVFATGVETEFLMKGGNTEASFNGMAPDFIPDIYQLINDSNVDVEVVYGDRYPPDLFCASQLLQKTSARVTILKNLHHSIPAYIHQEFNIYDYVGFYFLNNCFPAFDNVKISKIGSSVKLLDAIYFYYLSSFKSYTDCSLINSLKVLSMNECIDISGQALGYLGFIYKKHQKYDKAIDMLGRACLVVESIDFLTELADLFFINRLYERAIKYCDLAIFYHAENLNNVSYKAMLIKSKALRKKGELKEALKNLELVIFERGELAEAWHLRSIIEFELNYVSSLESSRFACKLSPSVERYQKHYEKIKKYLI